VWLFVQARGETLAGREILADLGLGVFLESGLRESAVGKRGAGVGRHCTSFRLLFLFTSLPAYSAKIDLTAQHVLVCTK